MTGTSDGAPRVVALVGPTAVGKTPVAEEVALALDGEIVSADSMQVYRAMDIGTAKPVVPFRVPYHCIDLVGPGEPYSAARYQDDARAAIARVTSAGRLPLVVGGTGLYVRAALDDWDMPPGDPAGPVRGRLEQEAASLGATAMHERLVERDPRSADLIHPHNTRRVIRALEMAEEGRSYADVAASFSSRRSVYDARFIGLTMERPELYHRIDARVERMIDGGLVEEVRTLMAAGHRDALTSSQAIGYKELVPVVEGDLALEDAVGRVKQATRHYAKRQLSWFRSDARTEWVDVTGMAPADAACRLLDLLSSSEHGHHPFDGRAT